jgi:hypothetical protein
VGRLLTDQLYLVERLGGQAERPRGGDVLGFAIGEGGSTGRPSAVALAAVVLDELLQVLLAETLDQLVEGVPGPEAAPTPWKCSGTGADRRGPGDR